MVPIGKTIKGCHPVLLAGNDIVPGLASAVPSRIADGLALQAHYKQPLRGLTSDAPTVRASQNTI